MIYVNGDSYPYVSDGKRYSEFLGEYFACPVTNNSLPGSCNSRIFRTSLRDLLDLRQKHKNLRAVISLTFPMRTEVWDQDILDNRFTNDGEFTSFQIHTSKTWFFDKTQSLDHKYNDYCKQVVNFYNVEAETVKILQNIILLSNWCETNNIDYVILSGALQETIDFDAPFVYSFYHAVKQNKQVIDIFTKSFTQWCIEKGFQPINEHSQEIHGSTYNIGHHGEQAHKAFANYLIDNYFDKI